MNRQTRQNARLGWRLAAGAALVLLAGCSRLQQANARLETIESDRARGLVRDCLWKHGSHYRWVERDSVRLEVERTDHAPGSERTGAEVWTWDIARGDVRIERPAAGEVILADGLGGGVFVGGKRTADLEARDEAAGAVRLVRELAAMPFSLLGPGLGIECLDSETGPAGARVWDRLLVRYGRASPAGPADSAVVEIRRDTGRVEAVILRWTELPFAGRRWRIEMDDWRPEGDLLVSHRWRFFPADDSGARAGPVRWTFRFVRWTWDVTTPGRLFSRP